MNNQILKTANYERFAKENIIPSPVTYQTVDVTFQIGGDTMTQFAEIDFLSMQGAVRSSGGFLPGDFTVQIYQSYLNTLVYSRIAWVNGGDYVIHPNDKIAVPAYPSVVMMNLGRAEDISKGIIMEPKSNITWKRTMDEEETHKLGLLTKAECFRVSQIIKSIPGASYGLGYLKDRAGTFDFMAMQLLNGIICTYTAETHPVYAMLASFLEPKIVSQVLSPVVRYGDTNYLRTLLWEVTTV